MAFTVLVERDLGEVTFARTPEGFWLAEAGRWRGVGNTHGEALQRLKASYTEYASKVLSAVEMGRYLLPLPGASVVPT